MTKALLYAVAVGVSFGAATATFVFFACRTADFGNTPALASAVLFGVAVVVASRIAAGKTRI